jgi:uridylate kinase
MEIQAEILCKATNVAGVYDRDPAKYSDAYLFDRLSYDRFIQERMGVMDATAVTLCRDNGLPIRVFALSEKGNIKRVAQGEPVGTLVTESDTEER